MRSYSLPSQVIKFYDPLEAAIIGSCISFLVIPINIFLRSHLVGSPRVNWPLTLILLHAILQTLFC